MPNDEVGLLLMGTDATDNPMNAAHGGYEHICEAFDVQCTTWHMLEVITSQVERGRHPGDWLDAILVALDMFNRHRYVHPLATSDRQQFDNLNLFAVRETSSRSKSCWSQHSKAWWTRLSGPPSPSSYRPWTSS